MPSTPLSTFTVETLESLVQEAHTGAIQIPEFQRDSILRDGWAKSLLASVSLGYPIGAVTLLETGDRSLRFASRPLARGRSEPRAADRLLVDGRQRLTCLHDVLASNQGVATSDAHGEVAQRWYYLDIVAALDPEVDRDTAVISVTGTGPTRSPNGGRFDVSTVELEWEKGVFPLRLVFGSAVERRQWQRGFTERGAAGDAHTRGDLMAQFESDVLEAFDSYRVPTIVLGKDTTRWSVRVHGGPDGPALADRFRVIDDGQT